MDYEGGGEGKGEGGARGRVGEEEGIPRQRRMLYSN